MPFRNSPLALRRGDDRGLQIFGHLPQSRPGPGGNNAAAGPDQRISGRRQEPRPGLHRRRIRRRRRIFLRLRQFHFRPFRQGFRRNFNFHRARPAGFQLIERGMHRIRDFRRV